MPSTLCKSLKGEWIQNILVGFFFALASIIEEAESCKECQKEVVLRFGPFLFCPTYYWNILQCYSFDWVKREQPLDRLLFGSRLTGDWQDVVALRYFSPLYFYSSSKKMKKKLMTVHAKTISLDCSLGFLRPINSDCFLESSGCWLEYLGWRGFAAASATT